MRSSLRWKSPEWKMNKFRTPEILSPDFFKPLNIFQTLSTISLFCYIPPKLQRIAPIIFLVFLVSMSRTTMFISPTSVCLVLPYNFYIFSTFPEMYKNVFLWIFTDSQVFETCQEPGNKSQVIVQTLSTWLIPMYFDFFFATFPTLFDNHSRHVWSVVGHLLSNKPQVQTQRRPWGHNCIHYYSLIQEMNCFSSSCQPHFTMLTLITALFWA